MVRAEGCGLRDPERTERGGQFFTQTQVGGEFLTHPMYVLNRHIYCTIYIVLYTVRDSKYIYSIVALYSSSVSTLPYI